MLFLLSSISCFLAALLFFSVSWNLLSLCFLSISSFLACSFCSLSKSLASCSACLVAALLPHHHPPQALLVVVSQNCHSAGENHCILLFNAFISKSLNAQALMFSQERLLVSAKGICTIALAAAKAACSSSKALSFN